MPFQRLSGVKLPVMRLAINQKGWLSGGRRGRSASIACRKRPVEVSFCHTYNLHMEMRCVFSMIRTKTIKCATLHTTCFPLGQSASPKGSRTGELGRVLLIDSCNVPLMVLTVANHGITRPPHCVSWSYPYWYTPCIYCCLSPWSFFRRDPS